MGLVENQHSHTQILCKLHFKAISLKDRDFCKDNQMTSGQGCAVSTSPLLLVGDALRLYQWFPVHPRGRHARTWKAINKELPEHLSPQPALPYLPVMVANYFDKPNYPTLTSILQVQSLKYSQCHISVLSKEYKIKSRQPACTATL